MGAWIVFSEKLHEPETGGPGDRARAVFRAVWREREFGMYVKEDAENVAAGPQRRLCGADPCRGWREKQVWVNPANVLYIEQYDEAKSERQRQAEAEAEADPSA